MMSTRTGTLVQSLAARGDSAGTAYAVRAMSVLFFAALTAASAQISFPIPFTQVPFTLQPMVVLLSGLTLGARLGLLTQMAYLGAGLSGLAVFAASTTLPPGILRLLGPTGGYLMSYPIAAYLTGSLAQRGFDRRYGTCVVAMAAGLAVVYASGLSWLAFLGRAASSGQAGFGTALAAGVAPFIVPDLLKLLAAAGIVPSLRRLLDLRD